MAERDAAQASGWITAMTGEDSGSFYLSQQSWVATRTRTVVIAGVKPASASGELAELHRESTDFSAAAAPRRCRAGVALCRPRHLGRVLAVRPHGADERKALMYPAFQRRRPGVIPADDGRRMSHHV